MDRSPNRKRHGALPTSPESSPPPAGLACLVRPAGAQQQAGDREVQLSAPYWPPQAKRVAPRPWPSLQAKVGYFVTDRASFGAFSPLSYTGYRGDGGGELRASDTRLAVRSLRDCSRSWPRTHDGPMWEVRIYKIDLTDSEAQTGWGRTPGLKYYFNRNMAFDAGGNALLGTGAAGRDPSCSSKFRAELPLRTMNGPSHPADPGRAGGAPPWRRASWRWVPRQGPGGGSAAADVLPGASGEPVAGLLPRTENRILVAARSAGSRSRGVAEAGCTWEGAAPTSRAVLFADFLEGGFLAVTWMTGAGWASIRCSGAGGVAESLEGPRLSPLRFALVPPAHPGHGRGGEHRRGGTCKRGSSGSAPSTPGNALRDPSSWLRRRARQLRRSPDGSMTAWNPANTRAAPPVHAPERDELYGSRTPAPRRRQGTGPPNQSSSRPWRRWRFRGRAPGAARRGAWCEGTSSLVFRLATVATSIANRWSPRRVAWTPWWWGRKQPRWSWPGGTRSGGGSRRGEHGVPSPAGPCGATWW